MQADKASRARGASARGRGRTPEERPDLGIAKRKPPRQTKRECGGACVNLTEEVAYSLPYYYLLTISGLTQGCQNSSPI